MAFPQTPLGIVVELYISGAWTDVTTYVRAEGGIPIERGRSNEQGRVGASTCTITFNNTDGRFSPRCPTSPYFGLIGRNTQVRVRVGADVRFVGEISAWPQRWEPTGSDVWVPVQASGILRRLERRDAPLTPPVGRTILADEPVAYWPLDDAAESTTAASAVAGVGALSPRGPVTLGVDGGPVGGTGAYAQATNVPWTGGTDIQAQLVGSFPATGSAWTLEAWVCPGLLADAELVIDAVGIDSGLSTIGWTDRWAFNFYRDEISSYAVLGSYGKSGFGSWATLDTNVFDGEWHHVAATVTFIAPHTIDTVLCVDGQTDTDGGTHADYLLPACVTAIVGHNAIGDDSWTFAVPTVGVAHVAVYDRALTTDELTAHYQAGIAYAGETAADRVTRLCAEAGVTSTIVGTAAGSELMGVQGSKTLTDLLYECADSDGGLLYETRDAVGLSYRTRADMYNQTSALDLSYSSTHLSAVPDPIDDDTGVTNDVTVKRDGGSSARAELTSGALSTLAPPDGVGRYDTSKTLSLYADGQCTQIAWWLLGLGTLDKARYPKLSINLARSVFIGDAALTAAAVAVDLGDVVTLDDLPAWLPPDQVALLVQGYRETLSTFEWSMTFNTSPADQYQVWTIEGTDNTGRLDCDGQTLAANIDTDDVSLSVATTSGNPLITTAAGDMPFDVVVGGEQMTVTNVTGASSPQTVTVTRSVNGVVKSHSSGAVMRLFAPSVLAR